MKRTTSKLIQWAKSTDNRHGNPFGLSDGLVVLSNYHILGRWYENDQHSLCSMHELGCATLFLLFLAAAEEAGCTPDEVSPH